MTLKIERIFDGKRTTLRLIGRISSEHVEELQTQIRNGDTDLALDLHEITLVDVEVVNFLRKCQAEGIELRRCSPYIREWMAREHDRER